MSGTVVVSQLGARMHYAVARIFNELKELERLYTDICAVHGWPLVLSLLPRRRLPASLRRLAGRVPHGIPRERVNCFEWVGLKSVLRAMLDGSRASQTAIALDAGHDFSERVVRSGFGGASGFYGMSGECLEQLRAARRKGLWTAVEQMIAPRAIVDRLVAREFEQFPDWESNVDHDPMSTRYADREMAEWEEADVIVCPSEFVRDGICMVGGPVKKCVVVPYGIDMLFRIPPREPQAGRPLRVLTVGAIGLRKGAPYVLAAARRMGGCAEFRMIGPCFVADARQKELREVLDLCGPVPRAEIMDHYAWADVFLLPSVCEGSATVTYEALAAGLPVITTRNSGSVVRHGVDGFIVDRGNVDAICTHLSRLNDDRELLASMSAEARSSANGYDLTGYARRLKAALEPYRNRSVPDSGEPTGERAP